MGLFGIDIPYELMELTITSILRPQGKNIQGFTKEEYDVIYSNVPCFADPGAGKESDMLGGLKNLDTDVFYIPGTYHIHDRDVVVFGAENFRIEHAHDIGRAGVLIELHTRRFTDAISIVNVT